MCVYKLYVLYEINGRHEASTFGVAGYHVRLTRGRSRVQVSQGVLLFFPSIDSHVSKLIKYRKAC